MQKAEYNIRFGSPNWIEDILSNLKHKMFIAFGTTFFSVEGPMQAVKFDLADARRLVGLGLSGIAAKRIGKDAEKLNVWLLDGKRYDYRSPEHMAFTEILIREKIYQNEDVFFALLMTGDMDIIHDLGHPDSPTTSLRREEFVGILTRIREELREIRKEYLAIIQNDYSVDVRSTSLKLEKIRSVQAEKARKKYILKVG